MRCCFGNETVCYGRYTARAFVLSKLTVLLQMPVGTRLTFGVSVDCGCCRVALLCVKMSTVRDHILVKCHGSMKREQLLDCGGTFDVDSG